MSPKCSVSYLAFGFKYLNFCNHQKDGFTVARLQVAQSLDSGQEPERMGLVQRKSVDCSREQSCKVHWRRQGRSSQGSSRRVHMTAQFGLTGFWGNAICLLSNLWVAQPVWVNAGVGKCRLAGVCYLLAVAKASSAGVSNSLQPQVQFLLQVHNHSRNDRACIFPLLCILQTATN